MHRSEEILLTALLFPVAPPSEKCRPTCTCSSTIIEVQTQLRPDPIPPPPPPPTRTHARMTTYTVNPN